MLTLKAELRNKGENPDIARKAGKVPAVFYGKKEASTPISVSSADFLKVWKQAGESTVVTLQTPDGEKDSLIQDVDLDPVTGNPRHADFYVFEAGHKLEVDLPIEFEGVSPAVKDQGGILVKVLRELPIKATAKDLPPHITVSIEGLVQFGDEIRAKDIKLPSGVELTVDPEEVVALVSAPREEKEEESAPIDLSSIEVEKKGKEEEEGDEAAAPAEESKE